MGKRENIKKADYRNIECQVEVLNSLIATAYYEIDSIYKNKYYIAWSKLSNERHGLYARNDELVSLAVEKSKAEDEEIQKSICGLSLYSIYMKAMEYKSHSNAPELYQAYLANIEPPEKEYVLNEQKIEQINQQITPYEKYVNDTQGQLNELWAATNYLQKQMDILISSFGFHKLSEEFKIKFVKQKLRNYPIDKKSLLDIQKEADEYREASLKRYKIHSGKMDGMPRPPQHSQISDPTGEALVMIEKAYERILKNSAEKVRKAADNIQWVESRLDRLNTTERRIVDLYYFSDSSKRYTWPDVAAQLKYTRDYCLQMDREIIKKLMN